MIEEDQVSLQQEREVCAERGRELNRQLKAEEDAKAMKAQALQMLQQISSL